MKITGLTISNFLGVPHLQHVLGSPILFIAGDNGAGKSSVMQAVRFALTGVMPRGVSKVADRAKLITEGASTGFVQVETEDGPIKRTIGQAKLTGNVPDVPYLDMCLDASQFARMDDIERRKMLFSVTGTKVSTDIVAEQMVVAGIDKAIIDQVLPRLRSGFEAASAFAKDRAAESRGAWRTITGETYGSVKAETWAASIDGEAPTAESIAEKAKIVADLSSRAASLRNTVAKIEASLPEEKLEELMQVARALPEHMRAMELAEATNEEATAEVVRLEALVRASTTLATIPCPCCGEALRIEGGTVVAAGQDVAEAVDHRPALAAAKVAAHDSHVVLQNCRRAVANAEAARSTLSSLPAAPTDEELKAPELLSNLLEIQRNEESALASMRRALDAVKDAGTRTEQAKAAHTEAVGWKTAEEALGAEGIPSILLARALDPVNATLAKIAEAAGWLPPAVTRDIELTYGGRAYALVSESEQWRADTMFSAAIATLTGSRMLLIDRFDVLAPAHRGEALDLLDWLIAEGSVDTIIASGTLKSKPDLGETIDVLWLGDAA